MKSFIIGTKTLIVACLFGLSALFTSCSKENIADQTLNEDASARKGAPAPGNSSIAQIAINAGFSELVAALSYVDGELNTGLVNLFLNGTDQYTVFAPTNAAFQNLYSALNVTKISDVTSVSSYRTIINQYFDMLGNIFGEKYKKYALEKYKIT